MVLAGNLKTGSLTDWPLRSLVSLPFSKDLFIGSLSVGSRVDFQRRKRMMGENWAVKETSLKREILVMFYKLTLPKLVWELYSRSSKINNLLKEKVKENAKKKQKFNFQGFQLKFHVPFCNQVASLFFRIIYR